MLSICTLTWDQIELTKKFIATIKKNTTVPYELIMVDNGSQDRSIDIAKKFPVQAIEKRGGTIGSVRNFGVGFSTGEILAFVDADCVVAQDWVMSFLKYFENKNTEVGIVGAPPCVPLNANLIQRAWFSHRKDNFVDQVEYVGSANLIISRALFNVVGGFDENIPSGEDFDLCSRVKTRGYKVISDYRIVSYHYGYPSNTVEFIKREIWHGKGMIVDFKKPLKSRPLMLSFLYLFLNIIIIYSIAMLVREKNNLFLNLVITLFGIELFPVVLLSLHKAIQRKSVTYLPMLTYLYYIYGMARSYSLMLIIYEYVIGFFDKIIKRYRAN